VKSETNTPAQKEFVAKLEARARKELNETHDVTYWDVASYDAVRLVADALKRGGPQAADYVKRWPRPRSIWCWDTMSLTKSAVRNPTD
jgi:ABC-type branched-subunit amino acid transport system substrate-binding protein